MPYPKQKKNYSEPPTQIIVTFKKSTVEKIRKIALASNKSVHDTILFIVNTAIKYNYTEDFRYIPCKPQSPEDIILVAGKKKKEPSYQIHVLVCAALSRKIAKIMELNSYDGKSTVIRSLVETAFIYDYDKNLFFHKPQKLSTSSSNYNPRSNDIIMLDII